MGNFAENLNLGNRVHPPPPELLYLLEKFDIVLFLGYLGYHLIGINMSTHVVKYFLC